MFFDIKNHLLFDTEPLSRCAMDLQMAVGMAYNGYQQGCRSVMATPPDDAFLKELSNPDATGLPERIRSKMNLLRCTLRGLLPRMQLFLGCELICTPENIDRLIFHLNRGHLPTLNGTGYVLVSFRDDIPLSDIWLCFDKLKDAGYDPILSHAESLQALKWNLHEIRALKGDGPRDNDRHKFRCKIQVDTTSFHHSIHNQAWARELIRSGVVDLLASDARNTSSHPVHIREEVASITPLCTPDYLDAITFRNAQNLFGAPQEV